jgi:hypothetical protein
MRSFLLPELLKVTLHNYFWFRNPNTLAEHCRKQETFHITKWCCRWLHILHLTLRLPLFCFEPVGRRLARERRWIGPVTWRGGRGSNLSSPQIRGELRRHRLEPLDHLAADLWGPLLCGQLSVSTHQGMQYSMWERVGGLQSDTASAPQTDACMWPSPAEVRCTKNRITDNGYVLSTLHKLNRSPFLP